MTWRHTLTRHFERSAWVRLAVITSVAVGNVGVMFGVAEVAAALEWSASMWITVPALFAWMFGLAAFATWATHARLDD